MVHPSSTHASQHTSYDSLLLPFASALTTFANANPTFGAALKATIEKQSWKHTTSEVVDTNTTHYTPQDETHAIEVARWLLGEATTLPSSAATRGHLSAWAANYEAPKDIVIGIVGLAIIGPTLGLIKKTKKKKGQLQIVIESRFEKSLTRTELAKLTQQLSQTVFAKELRLAGGTATRLHPDTADWYLGTPELKLYTETADNLTALQAAGEAEGITIHAHHHEGSLVAFAISPSVNDSFVDDAEVTKL